MHFHKAILQTKFHVPITIFQTDLTTKQTFKFHTILFAKRKLKHNINTKERKYATA
jgi:hypothetical protein